LKLYQLTSIENKYFLLLCELAIVVKNLIVIDNIDSFALS